MACRCLVCLARHQGRTNLTDNGSCYSSCKFRDDCREFWIKHKRTRPCWPQANGKAERFIRTALNEWAYAETYGHAWKRTACLPIWMHRYNFLRPHSPLAENLQLRSYAATCCHSILISIHLISGSAVRPLVCTKSQLYANSRRTRRS